VWALYYEGIFDNSETFNYIKDPDYLTNIFRFVDTEYYNDTEEMFLVVLTAMNAIDTIFIFEDNLKSIFRFNGPMGGPDEFAPRSGVIRGMIDIGRPKILKRPLYLVSNSKHAGMLNDANHFWSMIVRIEEE